MPRNTPQGISAALRSSTCQSVSSPRRSTVRRDEIDSPLAIAEIAITTMDTDQNKKQRRRSSREGIIFCPRGHAYPLVRPTLGVTRADRATPGRAPTAEPKARPASGARRSYAVNRDARTERCTTHAPTTPTLSRRPSTRTVKHDVDQRRLWIRRLAQHAGRLGPPSTARQPGFTPTTLPRRADRHADRPRALTRAR